MKLQGKNQYYFASGCILLLGPIRTPLQSEPTSTDFRQAWLSYPRPQPLCLDTAIRMTD